MSKETDRLGKKLIGFYTGFGLMFIIVVICFLIVISRKESNQKSQNQIQLSQTHKSQEEVFTEHTQDQEHTNNNEKQTEHDYIANEQDETCEKESEEEKAQQRRVILELAESYALGYDYEKAIALLKEYEAYDKDQEIKVAIASYQAMMETLTPYGAYESPDEISHVFFHSLIADTSKAFDGDFMENGYNYWMTTVDEFKRMLEHMYENGYVLVSIHDVSHEVTAEDGTTKMMAGTIMLPSDKKPFVLSQDDTNYYEYMKTDGFASRLVIDKDGNPACEIHIDGEVMVGRDYDVVPIVEKFIEEHPDFSYRGARGIIGVTGYEGVMGYRTNKIGSDTYEQDKADAKAVADRLKEIGWEFASHSYGHGHMGKESADYVKRDSERWAKEVASIIGETDIYLYPYGEDIIEGVGKYTGAKYDTLYSEGFRYFCGVYAYPWLQIHPEYVRMSRRNLDGYTMHFYPERLKDLFDVATTIDVARPVFQ